MNKNTLIALFFISLLVSGCNSPIEYCSTSETEQALDNLLTEQAIQLTSVKKSDYYDGASLFGTIKIRAALAQIRIDLENIKKVKQDIGGHKSSCSAQLKITIPPPMLSDVDLVRDTQHQLRIIPYAKQLHIDNSNNVFLQNIDYSVHAAKDIKTPTVNFENSSFAHLLDEIVTAVLLKSTLELKAVNNSVVTERLKPIISESLPPQITVDKPPTVTIKENASPLKQDIAVTKPVELESKKLPVAQEVIKIVPIETSIKQAMPSFNCSKAIKPTDITICNSEELARLDNENMQLYKNAKTIDPAITKDIWLASIKAKYACKTTVDCIASAYKKSMRDYVCVTNKDNASCKAEAPRP